MEASKKDQLVESARQAKFALETYTNTPFLKRSQGGDAMRLYDFMQADIPMMIAAANGKLGTPEYPVFDLKDDRMNARLDMDPMSLKQRIDQGYEAAKFALNWVGPHLSPDAAQFFKRGPEGGFEQLRDALIEQREQVHSRENTIKVGYERDGKKLTTDELLPDTDKTMKDWASTIDQFVTLKDGERVRIDVMKFEFVDEKENGFRTQYAVSNAEGQSKIIGDNDIDRGRFAYGVILERNDKTYFVPMSEELDGTPSGEAREIIGLESGFVKHLETQVGKENVEARDGEQMMREITGRDVKGYQQSSSGEVHYVSANNRQEDRGPIVLTGMPWMSGEVNSKELQSALRMADLQDFRTSNIVERAIVTNDVGTKEGPKADPNKMAMQLAAARAQGMAM